MSGEAVRRVRSATIELRDHLDEMSGARLNMRVTHLLAVVPPDGWEALAELLEALADALSREVRTG